MEVIDDVTGAVSGEQWGRKPLWSRGKRVLGEDENSFGKGHLRIGQQERVWGPREGIFRKRDTGACLCVDGDDPVERKESIMQEKEGRQGRQSTPRKPESFSLR